MEKCANRGSIFGFQIRSSRPLKFLRSGRARDLLEIQWRTNTPKEPNGEPLLKWQLRGSNHEVRAKLYRQDTVYRYWVSDAGWYEVDPVNRIIQAPGDGDAIVCEQRLWGMPALLCAASRQDFFLHAAAVEIDGMAVLLVAPGRGGKTTLAMAFHREGNRILSEDSACCNVTSSPVLFPGPPVLRLRPDVYDGQPPEGTRLVAVADDRLFFAIDDGRRGNDDPVPISAVLFLRDSENEIHCERVPAPKSLPDFWSLSFREPNDGARAQSFVQFSTLAGRVPIWNLYRPLRKESLGKTIATIVKTVQK